MKQLNSETGSIFEQLIIQRERERERERERVIKGKLYLARLSLRPRLSLKNKGKTVNNDPTLLQKTKNHNRKINLFKYSKH